MSQRTTMLNEGGDPAMDLRDYLYLDPVRLSDYASSLGISELRALNQTVEEERYHSGELDVPFDSQSPSRRTEERTLSVSDRHTFGALYERLKASITDVDASPDKVQKYAPVEATREFAPSPITRMIESLFEVIHMMRSFDAPQLNEPDSQQVLAMISAFFGRDDQNANELPMISTPLDQHYSVLFLAHKDHMLRSAEEFEEEVTVVGKVKKIVLPHQSLDLMDYLRVLPRNLRRSGEVGNKMKLAITDLFENWPEELGPSIERDALMLTGPVVVIDPLVVFS
jgi:hypothetical protein